MKDCENLANQMNINSENKKICKNRSSIEHLSTYTPGEVEVKFRNTVV
jgi:hypothetical protein